MCSGACRLPLLPDKLLVLLLCTAPAALAWLPACTPLLPLLLLLLQPPSSGALCGLDCGAPPGSAAAAAAAAVVVASSA